MRLSTQDIRLAARSFSRAPGFTIVAVVSLALAIALNTTMYSVIDAMVRPNLELRDPGRLYALQWWIDMRHTLSDGARASLLRTGFPAAEEMSSYQANFMQAGAVEYGRRYAQVGSATVAVNYFSMVGARLVSGRMFANADYGAPTLPVMISEGLADRLSPDKPFPIGATIDVNGGPRTVIGIVANSSLGPGSYSEYWVLPPATVSPADLPINVVRLRRDVTADEAAAQLAVLATQIARLTRESPKDMGFLLKGMTVGQFHPGNFDYALIAAVIAVLLVACANLANLQLARGIGRTREMALRSALGASRRDIVGQLMLESALLAATGLAAGLIMTYWGIHLLAARIPRSVSQYVIAPQTSWRVLVFAMVACVICVVLVGLYPALRVSRVDPNELLKSGHGTGANKRNRHQYGVMVAAEIGLSLALLSGASIVVRTAVAVNEVTLDPAIKALTYAWVFLARDTTNRYVRYSDVGGDLVTTVRGIPDAADVAYSTSRDPADRRLTVEQQGGPPRELKTPVLSYLAVSPGYMRAWHHEIVRGRDFLDTYPDAGEVIVDEQSAHVLWGTADPVGWQMKLGSFKSSAPWVRVVGVVKNATNPQRVRRAQYVPTPMPNEVGNIYYLPSASDSVRLKGFAIEMVVRARTDPARMPITLMSYLPKGRYVRFVMTGSMEEHLGLVQARQSHDFVASVFTLFAVLAIGLAAIGIYGIVNHSVAERKREIGVRLALGASPRSIIHAVLRDGNVMALAGVAIGLYLTKRSVGWLHAFSREGDEYDVVLFAIVAAALFTVAVVSAMGPALRATRIDPVESLRSE